MRLLTGLPTMKRAISQTELSTDTGRQPAVARGRKVLGFPRRFSAGLLGLATLCLLTGSSGCAAFRPVRGVPASYMPTEFQAATRENRRTIDLGMLVRQPPDQHRVEGGDILAVYVPGVLGGWSPNPENAIGEIPPINMPHTPDDPPTLGFPIQVRDDNTLPLPQLPPLNVQGLTLHETEEAIRKAYTIDHKILRTDPARIMVSLLRPREYRVLVVRQEAQSSLQTMQGSMINVGSDRRGIAREVRLRAYENDVMHALSRADAASGLPGLNAENTLYIIRNRRNNSARSCPPSSWDPRQVPAAGFMQIPAGEFGGHSLVHARHETTDRRQPIQLTGHQAFGASGAVDAQSGGGRQPLASNMSGYAPQQGYSLGGAQPQFAPPSGNLQGTPFAPQPSAVGFQGGYPAPAQMPPTLPPAGAGYPMETVGPSTMIPEADGHSFGHPGTAAETLGPTSPNLRFGSSGGSTPINAWSPDLSGFELTIDGPNVVKIPVRIGPGENPNLTEEDITLYDGDIVFIESRETEVFYTGGLLGGGQYTLPRDYDLHVLEAIAVAQGTRNTNSGSQSMSSSGGPSALNQDVIVSASRLVILRKLPDGNTVPIEIDLYRAMRYPHENIVVQAGDYLLLQYKCGEAVAAFVQRNLLEGALIGIAASTFTSGGGNK